MRGDAENDRPNIVRLFEPLRRHMLLIGGCSLLLGIAAFAYSSTRERQYSASAALFFRDPQLDQTLFGGRFFAPSTDPARESLTNRKLVGLPVVAGRAARRFPGLTARDVQSRVEVQDEGASSLVNVVATDPSPRRAAALANAVANSYIEFRRERDRSKVTEAQRLVDEQLAQMPASQQSSTFANSLRRRAQDLRMLAALQTGNAELAQPASPPTSPSSPKPLRNTILALFMGLVLGAGLAVLRERLDRRIQDPDELPSLVDLPLLALLPTSPDLDGRFSTLKELPHAVAEAFRRLRANLSYFKLPEGLRSVMVLSPDVQEGKSTVAWHLAVAAAEVGNRVILVEADLRRPTVVERGGLPSAAQAGLGLSVLLSGQASFEESVRSIDVGGGKMDVLHAGFVPPNPTDLLASDAMASLLSDLKVSYDFVVVDSPPILIVADTMPLLGQVDGVVVVARIGRTTRESLLHLTDALGKIGADMLGFVANGAKPRKRTHYGGGYYQLDESRTQQGNGAAAKSPSGQATT